MQMPRVEVVAFDVHQTLAHWPASRVEPLEVQRLLSRYGIEISFWAYDAVRQSILLLDGPKRPILGWMDFLALLFARLQTAVSVDLLASLAAMYEAREGMEPYPDAVDALRAVKEAGLRTCTFTTLPPFMLGDSAAALMPLVDQYCDCGQIGFAKGDRRFYQRITERLGVRPEAILSVGDDPTSDVALTAEAGWRPVLLDRKQKYAQTKAGQVATIPSLAELKRLYLS
jgi:FMN phosphatase YigB (HAD superfamily)